MEKSKVLKSIAIILIIVLGFGVWGYYEFFKKGSEEETNNYVDYNEEWLRVKENEVDKNNVGQKDIRIKVYDFNDCIVVKFITSGDIYKYYFDPYYTDDCRPYLVFSKDTNNILTYSGLWANVRAWSNGFFGLFGHYDYSNKFARYGTTDNTNSRCALRAIINEFSYIFLGNINGVEPSNVDTANIFKNDDIRNNTADYIVQMANCGVNGYEAFMNNIYSYVYSRRNDIDANRIMIDINEEYFATYVGNLLEENQVIADLRIDCFYFQNASNFLGANMNTDSQWDLLR